MSRVHVPVSIALPGVVQAWFYRTQRMTPDFVERFARSVEAMTGATLGHVVRNVFPAKLTRSIADETAQAWAREPRVRLSNAQGAPEPLQLLVGHLPRATDTGREIYAHAAMFYRADGSVAARIEAGFESLVADYGAAFARADLQTPPIPTAFEAPIAEGWRLRERSANLLYLPGYATARWPQATKARLEALGVRVSPAADGCVLRIAEPATLAAASAVLDAAYA
jgi:hypothetical protein